MYARKMSTHASDEKLLIHIFQDSLVGPALRWYMNLKGVDVPTFNDLAEAFIQQYQYNSYMAPDRAKLQAMTQEDKESFREYAQWWRKIASQIRPPLDDKELTMLFLETLSPFYYEKMVGCASQKFTNMIGMGMRIEEGSVRDI